MHQVGAPFLQADVGDRCSEHWEQRAWLHLGTIGCHPGPEQSRVPRSAHGVPHNAPGPATSASARRGIRKLRNGDEYHADSLIAWSLCSPGPIVSSGVKISKLCRDALQYQIPRFRLPRPARPIQKSGSTTRTRRDHPEAAAILVELPPASRASSHCRSLTCVRGICHMRFDVDPANSQSGLHPSEIDQSSTLQKFSSFLFAE
jgi:hypothetical protein